MINRKRMEVAVWILALSLYALANLTVLPKNEAALICGLFFSLVLELIIMLSLLRSQEFRLLRLGALLLPVNIFTFAFQHLLGNILYETIRDGLAWVDLYYPIGYVIPDLWTGTLPAGVVIIGLEACFLWLVARWHWLRQPDFKTVGFRRALFAVLAGNLFLWFIGARIIRAFTWLGGGWEYTSFWTWVW